MATLRHGPPVFHCGWMQKEGNNGTLWDRFMRLSGTALSNSHTERSHPTWAISLLEYPVDVGTRPLEFTIRLRSRLLSYFARSQEDFANWERAFKKALEMRIERFYKLGHVLGEGAFSQVVIGEDVSSADKFAIKIINKESYDVREMQFIMREVKIMMKIAHENIVNTYDIFDSMRNLHLVIEYMQGGELFDIIADQGHLSEKVASQIIREIIKGVDYLHEVGVVHCDIKPENILCKSKQWPLQVKLCDFGLANFYDKYNNSTMTAMIGTPGYVAPEVIQRKPYGPPVDMWACGVVLYVMLSGRMPFYGKDDIQCLRMTATGEYSFPDREWQNVSDDAKSLVRALLQIRPELRLTAKAALQHKWLATPEDNSNTLLQNDLSQIHSKVRQRFRKAVKVIHTVERMKDLINGLSQPTNGTASQTTNAAKGDQQSNHMDEG